MPMPILQKVLGHASIRTTALYWKNADTPQEKEYIAKWLEGKAPQKPKLRDNWQIFINIQQTVNIFVTNEENSDHKLLTATKEKNQTLMQELASRDKTITNLQKELAEQQLISEQSKNQHLELLLKAEKDKVSALIKQNSEKFAEDNQLIAKIEIPLKK